MDRQSSVYAEGSTPGWGQARGKDVALTAPRLGTSQTRRTRLQAAWLRGGPGRGDGRRGPASGSRILDGKPDGTGGIVCSVGGTDGGGNTQVERPYAGAEELVKD